MREILEEAAIIYRQEAENLLFVIAPAAVLGPVFVLVSVTGATAAFISIALVLPLYYTVYAASVQASGMIMASRSPDAGPAYLGVLNRAVDLARVGLPGGLLLGATWGTAAYVSDQGFPALALGVGAVGGGAAFVWAARRAFDLPLMLVHGASGRAATTLGSQMTDGPLSGPLAIVLPVAAPLSIAAVASLVLAFLIQPVFGGVLFAIAIAGWLPFSALSLSLASERLVDQAAQSRRQAQAAN